MIPTTLYELRNPSLDGLVQLFYVNAIIITVTLNVFPPFTKKLYAYGKTTSSGPGKSGNTVNKDTTPAEKSSLLDLPLDLLGALKVPHSWFLHFYAFSLAVQLFWLVQIFSHGRVLQLVLEYTRHSVEVYEKPPTPTIVRAPPGNQSLETVLVCIVCMSMQSARRVYETVYVQKHGFTTMGIMIYIAGILHYAAMGFAVWCEGVETIRLNTNLPIAYPSDYLRPPRLNTLIGLPIFFISSGLQNDAHTHLASLVKYSLPVHPVFSYTLAPHYLLECLIYFSFVIIGAPRGEWVNTTLLYVFAFVCVNQAFNSRITRAWYVDKFGRDKVGGMWTMVPFVW